MADWLPLGKHRYMKLGDVIVFETHGELCRDDAQAIMELMTEIDTQKDC